MYSLLEPMSPRNFIVTSGVGVPTCLHIGFDNLAPFDDFDTIVYAVEICLQEFSVYVVIFKGSGVGGGYGPPFVGRS